MSFWMGSRIPNLNEKAMMAGDTQLELLGFDQVLEIQPDDGFVIRVLYTTVNWVDTNKRGMTFGVVLAGCLMTLLSLFKRKSFKNGFANAMMGALIGAPLGVCVNCAAPIAKGLHAGGTRLETTMATMISSPTMNVIVLTMLFSLFPWYMVFTKIGISLAFIVIGIPVLCRLLYSQEQLETLGHDVPGQEQQACELPADASLMQSCDLDPGSRTWVESFVWLGPAFLKNLWSIIKTTVPLMLLAGFLGSLLIVALPWDMIVKALPSGVGPVYTLAMMGALTLFGTFLPVPIAFDVIVVAILITAGMPVKYGMVLLFTLGIFSVYSFHIVWRYISKPMAVLIFAAIAVLGIVAGITAHYVSLWDEARQRTAMYNMFYDTSNLLEQPSYIKAAGTDDLRLIAELQEDAVMPLPFWGVENTGIKVERVPFRSRGAASGSQFTAVQSHLLGIEDQSPFSLMRQIPPLYWGRGIATGDVHNDGWPDILVASDPLTYRGISLYANRQGDRFVEQRISVPELEGLAVINAALVDINSDGWLDIFVTAYRGGNYIVYNREGRFTSDGLYRLPDAGQVVTAAVTFGDVNNDGQLDIVLGNWSLGMFRQIIPGELESARNVLLIQEDGEFRSTYLKEHPGETLTTLLTDFNLDGHLDLIVGNDFEASDVYFHGDGRGGFSEITKGDGVIPHTTDSTMSIASADINNDLLPELFLAQITTGVGANFAESLRTAESECDDIQDKSEFRQCADLLTLNTEVHDSRNQRDALSCLDIDDR